MQLNHQEALFGYHGPIFKHINLKAAIANCSSIVAVARIKDGTIGLLKQVSDALFESIKEDIPFSLTIPKDATFHRYEASFHCH